MVATQPCAPWVSLIQQQQAQQQLVQQQQQQIITTHGALEVAALPLLLPFQIKKPNESTIINTIINEQHAADTLAAVLKQEERLRSELQKAKNKDDDAGGKKPGGDTNDGKKNASVPATKGKSKKNSKKNSSNNANSEQVKEIERKHVAAALTIQQCRVNLGQFAGWTKAMLQAEYSKLAVTLDEGSQHYSDLEEAFSFLCPRLNTADGTEDYYHEQRLAYVKEMIPVMKKVGEKNFATSLISLPYLKKFHADEPESPIVAALIDEMHQLAITEGVRVRLEKQLDDPAKFKVLKHAEEMLDQKEIETSELVRKHFRKRSIKLHPDRNGEVSCLTSSMKAFVEVCRASAWEMLCFSSFTHSHIIQMNFTQQLFPMTNDTAYATYLRRIHGFAYRPRRCQTPSILPPGHARRVQILRHDHYDRESRGMEQKTPS